MSSKTLDIQSYSISLNSYLCKLSQISFNIMAPIVTIVI